MSINLRGSYRALLGNAIEALSAAVEIYNKPKISYREECSIILLIILLDDGECIQDVFNIMPVHAIQVEESRIQLAPDEKPPFIIPGKWFTV